jgi:hypothetical protein
MYCKNVINCIDYESCNIIDALMGDIIVIMLVIKIVKVYIYLKLKFFYTFK